MGRVAPIIPPSTGEYSVRTLGTPNRTRDFGEAY